MFDRMWEIMMRKFFDDRSTIKGSIKSHYEFFLIVRQGTVYEELFINIF